MKFLVTGFNPFRGVRINPSQLVVEALAKSVPQFAGRNHALEIITAILPTEYVAAARILRRLIRTARPDGIICLGVASRREMISLERVALNLDDDPTPDNAGVVRRGRKIAPTGPDVYWSTFPLDAMQGALRKRGIKYYISNHAGTFLCNHAFYVARQEIARLRRQIPCGFVHLPGHLSEQSPGRSKKIIYSSSANIRHFVQAVECCIECCYKVHHKESARRRAKGTTI